MLVKINDKNIFTKPKGFIVFEGINGSGKGTVIKSVSEALASHPHILTREPGATPLGKEIRELLLAHKAGKPSFTTETLLFSADRSHHVSTVIQPALSEKKIVLGDRYFYSTLAFQGYGRGEPLEEINLISEVAIKNTLPDAVILLDLSVEEATKRLQQRIPDGKDIFEDEKMAFQKRIRDGYLTIAKERPEPFFVIDATKSKEEVFKEAFAVVQAVIENMR